MVGDGRWTDTAWSLYPFEGTVKQLIVEPKKMGSALKFEAYILTMQGALLHVMANGEWVRLGRVDEEGKFISERSVDICCLEAQNNMLTEKHLEVLLATDISVIDAVGGLLSVTPLTAACWSGSLKVVHLLLDNPYRLADPNVLSPHNWTPLYYAVSRCPLAHRREIVNALLDAGVCIDDTFTEDNFNTPLMHAVADMSGKDVIHELVDHGTSLTKKNEQGQMVVMLTEGTGLELECTGVHLDDTFAEDNFNAPLMNAVIDTGNKDVLHELADQGVSLTKKNWQGQMVVMPTEGAGFK
ncbi:hypothetical protein AN958_03908 [Leucoagaricus sp. SymC.cos]|nr:hypothetical protein AN958_03908 [Leucoagaricus sp. SymC.cos]